MGNKNSSKTDLTTSDNLSNTRNKIINNGVDLTTRFIVCGYIRLFKEIFPNDVEWLLSLYVGNLQLKMYDIINTSETIRIWVCSLNIQSNDYFKLSKLIPNNYDLYVFDIQANKSQFLDIKRFISKHLIPYGIIELGADSPSLLVSMACKLNLQSIYGSNNMVLFRRISTSVNIRLKSIFTNDSKKSIKNKGAAFAILHINSAEIAFLSTHITPSQDFNDILKKVTNQYDCNIHSATKLCKNIPNIICFGDLNKYNQSQHLWKYNSLTESTTDAKKLSFRNFNEPIPKPDFFPTIVKKQNTQNITKTGYLNVQTAYFTLPKKRWIVLNQKHLYCYINDTCAELKHSLSLSVYTDIKVSNYKSKSLKFEITCYDIKNTKMIFTVGSLIEMNDWIKSIKTAIPSVNDRIFYFSRPKQCSLLVPENDSFTTFPNNYYHKYGSISNTSNNCDNCVVYCGFHFVYEPSQTKWIPNKVKKILMLGSGQAGKSVIFKQLRRIYGGGFANKDRYQYVQHVHAQCIEQMQFALESLEEYINNRYNFLPDFIFDDSKMSDSDQDDNVQLQLSNKGLIAQNVILNTSNNSSLNGETASAIKCLWKEVGIKKMYEMRNVIKIEDTSAYFWNEIDRISAPEYIPNETDMNLVRYRTTGVIENKYVMDKKAFSVIDVGGQHSERKKWIHCYERVDALVFVVSLSCYDEVLFEDYNKNAMEDNLRLFEDICRLEALKKAPIILLLNKKDIFAEKIKKVSLHKCGAFSDYNGTNDSFEETTQYIKEAFIAKNKTSNDRKIYTYIICAIERNTIKRIFEDTMNIIFQRDLININVQNELFN